MVTTCAPRKEDAGARGEINRVLEGPPDYSSGSDSGSPSGLTQAQPGSLGIWNSPDEICKKLQEESSKLQRPQRWHRKELGLTEATAHLIWWPL